MFCMIDVNVTCKAKAVVITARARDTVSMTLKLRSMLMPIIQATTTQHGT